MARNQIGVMKLFTFGSDPEFMLQRLDKLQSAIGVLPSKEHAVSKGGSKFYHDNVLAEAAIKPGSDRSESLGNTESALKNLAKMVMPNALSCTAAAKYPASQLESREARQAGCNPEWDVYSLTCVLPPEEVIRETSFRTAGGHIHVGSDIVQNPLVACDAVRMMDLFIGVPSVFLDKDPTSKDRRRIYGHAGSHRPTSYGFEYRALGNFWLSCPEMFALIYDLTAFVLEFVAEEGHKRFWILDESLLDGDDPSRAYSCSGYDVRLLRKAINSCDRKQAEKFMMFISNYLPEDLYSRIDVMANRPQDADMYKSWGI